ncbi:transposase [Oxyplasma meridianum]|uniref:Transposase n=1 Tax=Oxyplasma meridianum TaxID=3073602 RepID=A0AAX4NHN8_9ARCH
MTAYRHLDFIINKGDLNSDDIISILNKLVSEIHGFLYIFLDNIMKHKSKRVKEYPGDHNKRLIARKISLYSPELNPDEFVWNGLKYQDLKNFCPVGMEALKARVSKTLDRMKSEPQRIRQIIRGKILPLDLIIRKS